MLLIDRSVDSTSWPFATIWLLPFSVSVTLTLVPSTKSVPDVMSTCALTSTRLPAPNCWSATGLLIMTTTSPLGGCPLLPPLPVPLPVVGGGW